MSFKSFTLSLVATLALTTAASAEMASMMVHDAYARASNKMAGAAFMQIKNTTERDDRLLAVRSEVAKKVQLHTHAEDANGVMKMQHVEEGFEIPAGATHLLERGGDHVMFMGLNRELAEGDMIDLILVFEQAGEVSVTIPVDLHRAPQGHGDHATHSD
ncbi:copper chaperone PCu(A)C [Tritonibacter horizontis]|uniref:Copper chaperone PCu(A)C n=1 Tax=Tritonibacter horizontis TaxID=1768241 RepID=A0A132BYJ4_9RHOB|nr:copper chaperone PCu(A)C [Tritonibacter horizontis]KUP93256.1 hypothetical protein TRIHO_18570 [Tritonibacter horizontis]